MNNWDDRNVIYNYPFQISNESIIHMVKRTPTNGFFERIYHEVNTESEFLRYREISGTNMFKTTNILSYKNYANIIM